MNLGRILTSKQFRVRAGISAVTEWRLHQRGEGPPRLRLTPGVRGRWGYPENLFEQWLLSRLDKPGEDATAS
jgi:hypothetical protein